MGNRLRDVSADVQIAALEFLTNIYSKGLFSNDQSE